MLSRLIVASVNYTTKCSWTAFSVPRRCLSISYYIYLSIYIWHVHDNDYCCAHVKCSLMWSGAKCVCDCTLIEMRQQTQRWIRNAIRISTPHFNHFSLSQSLSFPFSLSLILSSTEKRENKKLIYHHRWIWWDVIWNLLTTISTRTHINIRPENFRPNSFNFFVVIQCLATVATVALTPPRVLCVFRIKLKCVHLNRSNENVWV